MKYLDSTDEPIQQLLQALELDGSRVQELTIKIKAGSLVHVKVKELIPEDDLQGLTLITNALRTYKLVPLDPEEEDNEDNGGEASTGSG